MQAQNVAAWEEWGMGMMSRALWMGCASVYEGEQDLSKSTPPKTRCKAVQIGKVPKQKVLWPQPSWGLWRGELSWRIHHRRKREQEHMTETQLPNTGCTTGAVNHCPPPAPASAWDSQGHQAAYCYPQSHLSTLCLSFSSGSFSPPRKTDDVLSWKCKKALQA